MSDLPANSQQPAPQPVNAPPGAPGGLENALRNPLPISLGPSDLATTERIMAAARQQHMLIESLWQLFLAPNPPVELLILVRDFGKAHMASHSSSFSSDEARLIYLASIACAFVRSASKITSLSDEDILRLFQWAIKFPQTPNELRSLIRMAAETWASAGPTVTRISEDAGTKP